MKDIDLEFEFDHPRGRVWRALTDTEELEQWLMRNDFRPEVGHRFQFTDNPVRMLGMTLWNGVTDCEVLEVVENERLAYSFHSPPNPSTVVTYVLEDTESGGTRMKVNQTGFHGWRGFMMRSAMKGGWGKISTGPFPESLDRIAAREAEA